jgi:membrane protein YqaA with SNARE-associated domain
MSSFLAATLFPAQSEAVLAASILHQPTSIVYLVTIASIGNVLGACVNWGLGRFCSHSVERRYFSRSGKMKRLFGWYKRYGWITLLGSWVPFIGDPLTLCAGIMREPLWRFVLVVTIAKSARYLALALTVTGFFSN